MELYMYSATFMPQIRLAMNAAAQRVKASKVTTLLDDIEPSLLSFDNDCNSSVILILYA